MPDHLTIEQRHRNMAAIKGRDTRPEMVVRKWLWAHGFRYRLNHKRLPGKPDVVMRKYRTCIFINGCFWHGHKVESGDGLQIESSPCCKIPKTNRDFWVRKIVRNKERDVEVQQKLAKMGWHSITIWECELKGAQRERTLESLAYTLHHIYLQDRKRPVRPYEQEDTDLGIAMAAEDE